VVIDISRKRVLLDGEVSPLTYKEFELLQFLVLREGRTIDRHEIIATLWADGVGDDIPNERTIDVHVRRLRSKLGAFEDIVRTVRGSGYRFDRHADVTIRWASTPRPTSSNGRACPPGGRGDVTFGTMRPSRAGSMLIA
jgi:Response regulators consisting of a CheY-like receiver domain and a winged-helix DNA-binding domain